MLIKHLSDHTVVNSPTCGTVREILKKAEYAPLGVAICLDIQSTQGHYHNSFDEIYFVLDGEITLQIYNPVNKESSTYQLKANELCVVTKGLHHKVIDTSEKNRLCVISSPPFHADDEHLSGII